MIRSIVIDVVMIGLIVGCQGDLAMSCPRVKHESQIDI